MIGGRYSVCRLLALLVTFSWAFFLCSSLTESSFSFFASLDSILRLVLDFYSKRKYINWSMLHNLQIRVSGFEKQGSSEQNIIITPHLNFQKTIWITFSKSKMEVINSCMKLPLSQILSYYVWMHLPVLVLFQFFLKLQVRQHASPSEFELALQAKHTIGVKGTWSNRVLYLHSSVQSSTADHDLYIYITSCQ